MGGDRRFYLKLPGHDRAGGGERLRDLVVAVRGGHESRLECRWREVHAFLEHAVEERLEAIDVRAGNLVEAPDRCVIGKYETEHAAGAFDGQRDAGVSRCGRQAVGELPGTLAERFIKAGFVD